MPAISSEKNLVNCFTRRSFLGTGGLCLGSLAMPAWLTAQTEREAVQRPFASYANLLDTLRKRGHPLRTLGFAPDKSPIVGVKAGGTKKPAIFISAGAHSTEHAGVVAAVELIDRLQTKHEVWVIPTRDPIGLNGFRYALSLGLGETPQVESLADADALLRSRGEVLFDADETLLVLMGEYGFANRGLYRGAEKGAEFLEPLKGRRIYYPSRTNDMPGAGPLKRAYTLIVTPDGEVRPVKISVSVVGRHVVSSAVEAGGFRRGWRSG